jgi:glycosyltransferase involved in cell wall biosynthesis
MCVGLFVRRAFQQLGHEVLTAGPSSPEVYGFSQWAEYRRNDLELPNAPVDIGTVVELARTDMGWSPDVVCTVDQYDHLVITGTAPEGIKWGHLAIENFNAEQHSRSQLRAADFEAYFIQHDDNGRTAKVPLPVDRQGRPAEWFVFGADPEIHPLTKPGADRDKLICQIGTHYEPRPTIWNQLRARFDGAEAMPAQWYGSNLGESASTIFGKVFSYQGMADAYNRALCALSCSNVDFVPMRIVEAFAMGCVMLSDHVPSMVSAFGAPRRCFGHEGPTDPDGIWLAHSRDAVSMGDAAQWVRDNPDQYDAITQRAYALTMEKWLYKHLAARVLQGLGLE